MFHWKDHVWDAQHAQPTETLLMVTGAFPTSLAFVPWIPRSCLFTSGHSQGKVLAVFFLED